MVECCLFVLTIMAIQSSFLLQIIIWFGMEEETDFEQEVVDTFPFEFDETDALLANSLKNESHYVGKKLSTDKRVPGRIGEPEFYEFWRDTLRAPEFVLTTLREGYRFPFREHPPSSMDWNNRFICFSCFIV